MKHKKVALFAITTACMTLLAPTAFTDGNAGNADVKTDVKSDQKTEVCHVCRVHDGETEAEPVAATAEHEGHTYGFCSEGCRDKFLEAPAAYLPPVFPRPAPSFVVRDLEGNDFSSDELRGRVVLLDFWATWCQPCVKDLPRLSELHESYSDRGLSVVSLSIDEGGDAARKVKRMIHRKKASHPVYLDAAESPAWNTYLVQVVPAQFLIDAGGNIVAQWSGNIDLQEVEAAIIELLAESDEPGS